MSTRLVVSHRTGFRYDKGAALTSFNEVRLTPPTTAEQRVFFSRVEVTPQPWSFDYTDYWGTHVTAFEVHDKHDQLVVTASSTIDVDRPPRSGAGLTWEQVHEQGLGAAVCEFLPIAERVQAPSDLEDRVTSLVASSATPAAFVDAVARMVHDEVRYVTGSTDVATLAAEAWAAREGVCQDLAHLTIGALRAAGVPARYVSGYVLPDAEAPVGQPVAGESHAWVEWWDGTWLGIDPTNLAVPGDLYVEVAHGRDYVDVPPLSGVFTGGKETGMFVEVEITRLT